MCIWEEGSALHSVEAHKTPLSCPFLTSGGPPIQLSTPEYPQRPGKISALMLAAILLLPLYELCAFVDNYVHVIVLIPFQGKYKPQMLGARGKSEN